MVYSKLETMGLTAIGGRVSDVGVGGLILGGTIRASRLESSFD